MAGGRPGALATLQADSVWRRVSSAGRGLRIGAVAGGMVGVGFGLAYLSAIQELDETDGARSPGAVLAVVGGSTLVGAIVGGAIGAGIGSLFHHRVLVPS